MRSEKEVCSNRGQNKGGPSGTGGFIYSLGQEGCSGTSVFSTAFFGLSEQPTAHRHGGLRENRSISVCACMCTPPCAYVNKWVE